MNYVAKAWRVCSQCRKPFHGRALFTCSPECHRERQTIENKLRDARAAGLNVQRLSNAPELLSSKPELWKDGPCACGDCVACEFAEARARRVA